MKTENARVLVVGSYAVGEVMQTERLPGEGETVLGSGFRMTHGGKGSNQAVQAARLGAQVAFLARVGEDAHGRSCRELHTAEGVRTTYLESDAALPTGVGFIIVDKVGNNLICVDLGANRSLTPEKLADLNAAFQWANVVLAQLEIPLETAMTAMRMGREAGCRTILNPAPAAVLTENDLSVIDFLLPNESEAAICAGDAGLDRECSFERLFSRGCKNILMTQGAQGAHWAETNAPAREFSGFAVSAVDTVGAGDAFSAAFAVGLGSGWSVEDAIRFANATAALSVTRADTIASYHRLEAVEQFLNSHPPRT